MILWLYDSSWPLHFCWCLICLSRDLLAPISSLSECICASAEWFLNAVHPVSSKGVHNDGPLFSSSWVCYIVEDVTMKLPNKTYIFIPQGNKTYWSTFPRDNYNEIIQNFWLVSVAVKKNKFRVFNKTLVYALAPITSLSHRIIKLSN